MRDASCRASPSLTEHRRDVAPPVEAPQPDLPADDKAEEQDDSARAPYSQGHGVQVEAKDGQVGQGPGAPGPPAPS